QFRAPVTHGAAGSLIRSSVVITSDTAPDASASRDATITGVADLGVAVNSPDKVSADGTLTFHYTLNNRNAFNAPNVQADVAFTKGSQFISADGVSCAVRTATNLTCTVPDVAANATRDFSITIRPLKPQEHLENGITITWDDPVFKLSTFAFVTPV